MKNIILFFLFIPYSLISQDIKLPTDSTGKVVFTEVVLLDSNISANELYKRAKSWFVQTYNSSKEVIQDEDKETHTITGRAVVVVHMKSGGFTSEWGHVKYTISITCKDGRYKYSISDFYHENPPYWAIGTIDNNGMPKNNYYREKDYYRVKDELNSSINSLIVLIKEGMNKKLASSSNDW